jgi:uncharacterized protein (TIGR02118 family)
MITGDVMRGSYEPGIRSRPVRTVVAVWDPEPAALTAVAASGAAVHRALADQGPYARGTPFGALVVGDADLDPAAVVGGTIWAWRVEEHVPRRGAADCAVGMVSLMRRRPGTTHAEFATHWTQRHGPLALRRHVGLAGYHQFVVVEQSVPAGAPEIDGVALLGFATRSDFETRFFDSDEGRAEILEDVARFMDRPGRETTLVGPAEPPRPPG